MIEQQDREAAANYMAAVSAMMGEYDPVSMAFSDPACDDLPIVGAMARHREQAETATVAKIVAWLRKIHEQRKHLDNHAGYYANKIEAHFAAKAEAGDYRK